MPGMCQPPTDSPKCMVPTLPGMLMTAALRNGWQKSIIIARRRKEGGRKKVLEIQISLIYSHVSTVVSLPRWEDPICYLLTHFCHPPLVQSQACSLETSVVGGLTSEMELPPLPRFCPHGHVLVLLLIKIPFSCSCIESMCPPMSVSMRQQRILSSFFLHIKRHFLNNYFYQGWGSNKKESEIYDLTHVAFFQQSQTVHH